jgi:N-acetylglucosaminyl-diphospho-decaprenol L-rhamnosyltransferase
VTTDLTPQPLRGANIGCDVVQSTIFAARRADIPLRRGGREQGDPSLPSPRRRGVGGEVHTVTVVVVGYNGRDLLARCLDSVLADLGQIAGETIVVDNASRDGTAEMVAEQFPDVRVIANRENIGYGGALNHGIAVASGKYVLVLNQDIALRPGALREMMAFAEAHPDAGAVGPRLEYEDGRFQHSAFRFPDWKQAFFGFFDGLVPIDSEINGRYSDRQLKEPFAAEHLLGACMLLRRAALDQAGAFDPTFFMYYEETDLCVRLVRSGWRNYYLPSATVMHVSAASTSAASEQMSVQFHRSQAIFYRRLHGPKGYALLKAIVWAGIGYRLARSLRAFARGRISADLLRERVVGYWRILWF